MNLHNRKAFTLVELLAVIAIIGVLMALLLPTLIGAMRQARVGVAKSDLAQLALALERFQADFGDYPPTAVPGYSLEEQDSNWDADVFEDLDTPGECLWFFLCNKFEAGYNDNQVRKDAGIAFTAADLPERWKILDKVTAGPYIGWKGKQLADNDEDGIPELLSPSIVRYKEAPSEFWHWRSNTSKRIYHLVTGESELRYLGDAGRYWYIPHWQYSDDRLVFDTYKWDPKAEGDLPDKYRQDHSGWQGILVEWLDFPLTQVDDNGNPYKEDGFQFYWLGTDGCIGEGYPSDKQLLPAKQTPQKVGIGDDCVNW